MSGILSTTGMTDIIMNAFKQTLYMVFWSTLFSVILGFIPAIILTLTAPDGLKPNKIVYEILSFIVNVFRSFPFIILLVILIPFTRLVVGKAIGTTASIVPLTISAIPYIARVFETSLRETNPGVIEAARSFGASNFQILMRVYVKESIPRMLNGIVLLSTHEEAEIVACDRCLFMKDGMLREIPHDENMMRTVREYLN